MKTPLPQSMPFTSPRFRLLHASPCRSIWIPPPFPLWPRKNLPYLVFHNGVILLNHSFLPHIMLCILLEARRLRVNQLCHQCHITNPLWWYTLSKRCLWRIYLPGILHCGSKPLRPWPSVNLLWLLDIRLLMQLILQVND